MPAPPDSAALADLLPGAWAVAATNSPLWLNGLRLEPKFTYGLVSRDPLVLSDDVSYLRPGGQQKNVIGLDRWRNGELVWRGSGWLRFVAHRWQVCGASGDHTIVALRFSQSIVTPAGVDILVREGVHHPELRAIIASATPDYGLSPEDFASLSWLAPGPERSG